MLAFPSTTMLKAFPQFAMMCVAGLLLTSAAGATEPPITAVAFAPDGRSVVAVSQSGLQEFSWPQLQLLRTVGVAAANLHCLAFSADGRHLAVGGGHPAEDGIVQAFTWPEAKPMVAFEGHSDSVRSVAWAGTKKIVSASLDRELRLWDFAGNASARVHTYAGHSRGVSAVLVLKDGQTMVTAGDDQSVRVWDINSGKLIRSLNQHTQPIHSLALRPTESGLPMVASAGGDRTIRFWQPTIGRMVRYARLDSVPLCTAWLDEDRIAASCVDGHVRVVDINDLKVLHDLNGVSGWAYALTVDPSDEAVVVAGSNGQIQRLKIPATTTN